MSIINNINPNIQTYKYSYSFYPIFLNLIIIEYCLGAFILNVRSFKYLVTNYNISTNIYYI